MDHDDISLFSIDQIEELLELSCSSAPIQQLGMPQNDQFVATHAQLLNSIHTEPNALAELMEEDVAQFVIPPPLQSTGPSEPVVIDSVKPHSSSVAVDNAGDNSRNYQKKITHREVEKQRRQEMSSLHQSLRSLLPVQRLKGKRSMADHIHATVGYVRQLQESVEKLNETRDQLKQLLINPSFSSSATGHLPSCSNQTSVTVQISLAGLEVIVNTDLIEGVKLSRLLNILIQEGLSITSCFSRKVDGRLLYKIETEVNDGSRIDSIELQQRLTAYCNGN